MKNTFLTCSLMCLSISCVLPAISAADVPSAAPSATPVSESRWNGLKKLDFQVVGRPCLLIVPAKPLPGNPWIWRTEFFNAFPVADIELAKRGFHVGYINMENMYGCPDAMKLMDAYYDHVVKEYKLSAKPILEGFSRGGLFAFNWAAGNASKVSGLYVDAPVCDFKSWPGGKGKGKGSPGDWDRLCKMYKLTPEQAMAYKKNPVDTLAPLAKAKVPILAVVGDADDVVPVAENTAVVEKKYKQLGGSIHVIHKPGVGHHPHSLQNPAAVVDFAFKAVGATPPKRIVCIGDSITFGAGTTPAERWSTRLQNALGDKYDVYNLGISATTLQDAGDSPYAKKDNYTIARQIEGDIILLALGTNDSKPQNWKGTSAFSKDYEKMIKELRASNPQAKIYCLLPVPAFPENYGIRDTVIKGEVIPAIKKVARKNKCEVIDLYTPMIGQGAKVPDKVHPNGEGHAIMAEHVYKGITGKRMPK